MNMENICHTNHEYGGSKQANHENGAATCQQIMNIADSVRRIIAVKKVAEYCIIWSCKEGSLFLYENNKVVPLFF